MTDFPSSPVSETVSLEQLRHLQDQSGIPDLPTQLTYQARMAVGGEGPRAGDWFDKPHRIVYDLCREIERMYGLAQCQQQPVAMLGGIHGVALIRHIEAMQPEAQKEYHTPLYALSDTSTVGNSK